MTDENSADFAALNLPAPLMQALSDVGYETPSPIQAACIPHLLAGQDLIGEAQTGTGKTAAFALPILARIDLDLKAPQALVLTPTRELALQVAEAFQKYARHLPGFHVLPLYGGQSMVVQLRALSRGAQVIVGTPGRVMDHIERKSLNLVSLATLVLDEADEMLRMGFIDDVEWILGHTPQSRQTALFSATMPEPIRRIAKRYQREPQQVKIRAATQTVAAIRQRYWKLGGGVDKLDALTRILEAEADFDAAIVFVRTRTATVELAEKLEARGFEAAALNGEMIQGQREQVIERLKNGALDIVVATDVAARGLDVTRITHVFNYDIPYDTEAYVHRIGRTGRAGRTGHAVLFVNQREMRMLKAIEAATRQKIEPLQLPSSAQVTERRVSQFMRQVTDALESEELDFFVDVVRQIETETGAKPLRIAAALVELLQRDKPLRLAGFDDEQIAVAATPVQSEDWPRPKRSRAPSGRAAAAGGLTRWRIEVGRAQGATPREIVGALANEGGFSGGEIGQIHLFTDHSTVELPAQLDAALLQRLKRIRVRQTPINLRPAGDEVAPERAPPARQWQAYAQSTGKEPTAVIAQSGKDASAKPWTTSPKRKFEDAQKPHNKRWDKPAAAPRPQPKAKPGASR